MHRRLLGFHQALCFPWAKMSLHNSLMPTLHTRSSSRTGLLQRSFPEETFPPRRADMPSLLHKSETNAGNLILTAFVRGMDEVRVFFSSLRYTKSDVASELCSWQITETDIHSCGETHGFARISLCTVLFLGLTVPVVSRQGNTA